MIAGLLRRAGLAAQRAGAALPAPVRTLGRRLTRVSADAEGWERPLVGAGLHVEWPQPPSASRVGPPVVRAGDGPRCLVVTDSLDVGGVDQFAAFLARRLPEAGMPTAVVVAASPGTRENGTAFGPVGRALVADGIEVIIDDDPTELRRRVDGWGAEVVSMHAGSWSAVRRIAETGVPIVETLHGAQNLNHADEVGVLSRVHALRGLVAVSGVVARQFLAVAPEGSPRPLVIPNGIDPSRVGRVDRAAARRSLGVGDEPLLVSLGRLSPEKNAYALQSAFDDVADTLPTARLVVCGRVDDPGYLRQMHALRERMRHGDRVHIRRSTTRPDVLLSAADLFVSDSFFEGWSLATMEALGSGIPIVTSDVGGAREQLDGGPDRGVMVPNPLGDPLAVDWAGIGRARFRVQQNRGELVSGIRGVLDGSRPVAARDEIAEFCIDRFRDEHCVAAHAAELRSALTRSAPGAPPR